MYYESIYQGMLSLRFQTYYSEVIIFCVFEIDMNLYERAL
jgi:hypothetical protein